MIRSPIGFLTGLLEKFLKWLVEPPKGGHGHSHDFDPSSPCKKFKLAIVIALNGALGIIQMVILWRIAGSIGVLTDGFHNFSDMLALGLSWWAMSKATVLATSSMTKGHERTPLITATFNYLLLLIFMMVAIGLGFYRLFDPAESAGETITSVGAVSLVVNAVSLWLLYEKGSHDLNFRSAYEHTRSDLISSAGVMVAGLLIAWTSWRVIDPIFTIALSSYIVKLIAPDTWESLRLLAGCTPRRIDPEAIREYLLGIPGVIGIHRFGLDPLDAANAKLSVHLVLAGGTNHTAAVVDFHALRKLGIPDVDLKLESHGSPCPHKEQEYSMAIGKSLEHHHTQESCSHAH